jgi:glycerol-3-phosphate dehydrogenase (NAD(P)+)
MSETSPVAVLGAGSWGTALAVLLARNQQAVRLWDHDVKHISELNRHRRNQRYLPDILLPEKIAIISELTTALDGVQDILLAVPSHAFREVINMIKSCHVLQPRIFWGTKGIDPRGELLDRVVSSVFGNIPMALIAGPSFAREVALNLPTAITLACNDEAFADDLVTRLHNANFRVYVSNDIIGAQICGAVKNVLAIAVGTSDGLMLGANARCALITRGLAEMARLGIAMGGKRETFMGLAGLGDLVLTATDDQSRNRRFGLALGSGKTLKEAQDIAGKVVEGMNNAEQVYQLAKKYHVEMPIVEQVYRVLHGDATPQQAVNALLARDIRSEC